MKLQRNLAVQRMLFESTRQLALNYIPLIFHLAGAHGCLPWVVSMVIGSLTVYI